MYFFRGGTPAQEDFLDVQSNGSFQVADSLEYVFAADNSETLSTQAGTFSVAFADQNVYQTGNETLGVRAGTFSVTDEHIFVEQTGSETLSAQAGAKSVTDEFMFVDPGAQSETVGVQTGTFSVTVSP